uniref:OsmC-like protein n=1 Tax=Chromera velia CCMP2878 TaxID=1169474 RepID=A0A0G4H164_9ALVE|eukprot:Cvel_821.t1-p1 / transcript=Cvel_821.t1 / gene=Cvel_821 / organism=Chromera_velia_CCMP2878 / gene_product=hypothetical protein / transcript_product=hypothetical protein / location=Cvel_scaffold25:136573-139602(+) / protein_length=157 / sequence_SO=supercontig / SO=protein_coding / is_pseudo=false
MALRRSLCRLFPAVKYSVTAEGAAGPSMQYKAGKHSQFTDEPPKLGGQDKGMNPMETCLGSLCGCVHVLTYMVAKEMGLKFEKVGWSASCEFDPRGLMGKADVQVHWSKLILEGTIKTDAPDEQVQELLHKVEKRCPISSLMSNVKDLEYIASLKKG